MPLLTRLCPWLILLGFLLPSSLASTGTPSEPGPAEATAAQLHSEAFLGKDEAPEFTKISPDEAKIRLTELLHKVDTNGDQSVSLAEMTNWLRLVSQKDRVAAAKERFRSLKQASDSAKPEAALTFEEYQQALLQELLRDREHLAGENATASDATVAVNSSHAALMSRSRTRWNLADANSDGRLTVEELADFLRPEESPRMRGAVVQEALDNADTNRDGRIDMGEHLRDLYPDYDKDRREGKTLPDWVSREEAHFRSHLDLDKDGSLSESEIYKLAVPDSADHALSEAQFLFSEADSNGDQFLSLDEVLNKWKVFVGHGATQFGAFNHQEL